MEYERNEAPAEAARVWQAPTLSVFAISGETRNFTNPNLNNDSSANYYTSGVS